MTPRELALAALQGTKIPTLPFMPITMSFAAYQKAIPYRKYATVAAELAECQMLVAEKFSTSHVSVISDPGVEASDLGGTVIFPENDTPHINENNSLLIDKKTLKSVKYVRPEDGRRMSNRLEAVRILNEKSDKQVLVEGWVEGPCAEAADLRGLNRLMMDFFDDPFFVRDLMDFVTQQEIDFALAQLKAGAEIIGIGDAASSLIGPELYAEYCVPRTRKYIETIHNAGGLVRLHICGKTEGLAESWKKLGADMIDIDYGNSMKHIRSVLGSDGAVLAGNLDPVREVCDGDSSTIKTRLTECFNDSYPGYIVGAGCEIPLNSPNENLFAMKNFALGIDK